MVSWSGRRKTLTILAFIGPTLIGVLIFNIYPILFNTYISLTNRNQYHPNPDCSVGLTGVLEPSCWPMFAGKAPKGLGTPFRLQTPVYGNYATLFGKLFTPPVLLAFAQVLVCLVPLWLAAFFNRRWEADFTRPVPSWLVTFGGLVAMVLLAWLLNVPAAFDVITKAGDFFVVTFRSVLYVVLCIPLFLLVALMLALILNSTHLPGRTFFRVVLIIPWAASTVAIMMSLVWQFFFREKGTINQVLSLVGIKGIAWLNDPTWAFAIVVLVNIWYTYPFFMVTILGALQSIPADQYEAAEIDGANYWQQLNSITLPLLRPAIIPVIVLSSISTFQMFGTVWAITAGGPSRGAGSPGATELVMVYAYKQVFQTNAYGLMGAFAVIMFIGLFAATLYSLRITRVTKGAYE
jgi:arabinogalactan oligomer / maltooligosaccharide transport system permease protein